ncbi:MAG: Lrp/AsnC family transcriptional regulator [Candidatus Bathyarchaeia archaeon]|nr:Lrp/AsnC family transcriptional regulator [Candidatus Bathyarchaeota archaeon]
MARRGTMEQDLLNVLMNAGEEGILQSELWKTVTSDSREGSRAILRLEKKKLIERRKELYEGRWTYRVTAKRRVPKVDSIIDVPCAFCEFEDRCGQSSVLSPTKCEKLTIWLINLARK